MRTAAPRALGPRAAERPTATGVDFRLSPGRRALWRICQRGAWLCRSNLMAVGRVLSLPKKTAAGPAAARFSFLWSWSLALACWLAPAVLVLASPRISHLACGCGACRSAIPHTTYYTYHMPCGYRTYTQHVAAASSGCGYGAGLWVRASLGSGLRAPAQACRPRPIGSGLSSQQGSGLRAQGAGLWCGSGSLGGAPATRSGGLAAE